MHELLGTSLPPKPCYACGRADVHGLKGIISTFYVQANGIHYSEHTADRCGNRAVLIDVGMHRPDLRTSVAKNRRGPVGVP